MTVQKIAHPSLDDRKELSGTVPIDVVRFAVTAYRPSR
jgi:hypothetical protein